VTTMPVQPADNWAAALNEARPAARQDLVLSQADYRRFRLFVLDKIGLDYPEDKRSMLGRGLAEAMTAVQCSNLDQLYDVLQRTSTTSHTWDQLVSALTVGETYFFRNASHFDALTHHILPALVAQREHSTRRIRIWSAGCSSGEEPYSIAILLREILPQPESWNIFVLATDINREALDKSRAGVYGPWSFRGVDRRIQERYFRLAGKHYVLDAQIKRMVTFDYLNLVGDPYPSLTNNTNAMDVILCRNVTIYFSAEVTLQVVNKFHQSLTDGGWLIPGPSEPNMVFYGDFEPRNFPGTVVYQKHLASKPAPAPAAHTPPFVVRSVASPLATPAARSTEMSPAGGAARRMVTPLGAPLPPVKTATPASQPDAFQAAVELMQTGRADEAIIKLHETLEQEAAFVPAYYTLGKIYANKGNLEEAQNWCERAIKQDKLHAEPYYTLSLIYQQHGLLSMAVDMLKKAIYLDRGFVLAHYNLAQLYRRQGDQALARKSLQNAQQLLLGRPREQVVPEGDGLVVGRLSELIENELAG